MIKETVYIDTSVYFAFIVKQDDTLKGLMEAPYTLCSSTLLFAETQRNLVYYLRQERITDLEFKDLIDQVQSHSQFIITKSVDLDLSLNWDFPPVSLPKTLDLIHIRTADWFSRKFPQLLFLSLDQQQNRAAREMGLNLYFR